MRITILLCYNDNEQLLYNKKNYHNEKLGIASGYGTRLEDKSNKKIKNCYPASNVDRKSCSIAFNHQNSKIICNGSFFKGDKQLAMHDGTTLLKGEYAQILNSLKTLVRDTYENNIHNTLGVREFAKFNCEWQNNQLSQPKDIRFGPIEYLQKGLIDSNKTIFL